MRHAGAAGGAPGARRELQAAVVAVSGVDGPVASGLALSQGVPAGGRGGGGGCGEGGQAGAGHGNAGEACGRAADDGAAGGLGGSGSLLHGFLGFRPTTAQVVPDRPCSTVRRPRWISRHGVPRGRCRWGNPAGFLPDHEKITKQD
ncbi:hypothetical protein ACFFX0_06765 [Citricoccus parietis]|uniref:Uncharacterized protein n=1 Tax=Citricoccus parietis TaxID=592307 RepID=A0ABV5FW44_9MICC